MNAQAKQRKQNCLMDQWGKLYLMWSIFYREPQKMSDFCGVGHRKDSSALAIYCN